MQGYQIWHFYHDDADKVKDDMVDKDDKVDKDNKDDKDDKGDNICYIFEKQRVQGYQIWHFYHAATDEDKDKDKDDKVDKDDKDDKVDTADTLDTFPHFSTLFHTFQTFSNFSTLFKLFHTFSNFSTIFQTCWSDKDKDKVDKCQPTKSYILWKLMTPTITRQGGQGQGGRG